VSAARSPLVFLFIAVLINFMGYGMVLPLLPLYAQQHGAGATLAGALGSVYAGMELLAGPVIGALSDRHGRRPVLLVCLAGTALACLLLGLAQSLEMIFAAIALDGLTGGNLSTAYAYVADVSPPERRARSLGLIGAAFGLGMMAGPALGGLLAAQGLALPAFLAAGLAAANVLFGLLVLPESLPPERRNGAASGVVRDGLGSLGGILRLPGMGALLVGMFTLNLAFSGLQNNFPLYSRARFAWTPAETGVFYAFVGACAVFIQGFGYGWLHGRRSERALTRFGLLAMAVGLLAMALAPAGGWLFPAAALVALGSGTAIPSLTALASRRAPAEAQGRLMGATQTLLSLAMILGPALAGVTFELLFPGAPYLLGAALSILAAVIVSSASHNG